MIMEYYIMKERIFMNKYMRIAVLCGALAACMLLCSCGQFGGGREQIDNVLDKVLGTVAPETTAPEGTTAAPEAEPIVRYDYMTNDMSAFVSLSKEQYASFTVNVGKDYLVTDDLIDEQIQALLCQYATATNGTTQVTDQPIRLGDHAYIYYRGEIDGKEFASGSNMSASSPSQLVIGSGTFIPGFEEGLIGVVPADTSKDNPYPLHVTFPENYKDAEFAGKDAIFYVSVEYVVQYELPELNDAFVKDTLKYTSKNEVGTEEGALVADYKAYIKSSMEASALEAAQKTAYGVAMEELLSKLTFTSYPEGEVQYYYDYYMEEIEYYFSYYSMYYGYKSVDEFAVDYMGLEKGADWKAALMANCQQTVQASILVHALAEIEGIEQITDQEFQAELDYLVDYYSDYNYSADYIRQNMGDDAIKESALYGKIMDLIVSKITITYN